MNQLPKQNIILVSKQIQKQNAYKVLVFLDLVSFTDQVNDSNTKSMPTSYKELVDLDKEERERERDRVVHSSHYTELPN